MLIQDRIKFYADLWQTFKEQHIAHDDKLKALNQKELDCMGIESYMACIKYDGYSLNKQLQEVAGQIFNTIIRLAEKHFSGDYSKLSINDYDLKVNHLQGETRDDHDSLVYTFDPAALWMEIEAEYGNEKGEEVALQQAAAVIINKLNISTDSEVKIVKGAIVLNQRIWIDSFDKKWSNRNRMSYGCKDNVVSLLTALNSFLKWAGVEESSINSTIRTLGDYHRELNSRENFSLAPNLNAITYLERIEYRFGGSLGESLQCFVSTYGHLPESRQAA